MFAGWGIRVDGLLGDDSAKDKKIADFTQEEFLDFVEESLLFESKEQDVLEEQELEALEGDESLIAKFLMGKLKDSDATPNFLMILTSQSKIPEIRYKDVIPDYSEVIFICDTDFAHQDAFSCGYDFVEASGGKTYTLKNKDVNLTPGGSEILDFFLDGKRIFVIPESYLVSPLYDKTLANYFFAISRAKVGFEPIAGKKLVENETKMEQLQKFKGFLDTPLYEISVYTFSLIIFALVFFGVLKILVKTPKKFIRREFYSETSQSAWGVFLAGRRLFVYPLVILLVLYIPLVIVISIRDMSSLDFGYIQKYVFDTFSLEYVYGSVKGGHIFRALFVLYNLVLATLLVPVLAPNLINFVKASRIIFRRGVNKSVSRRIPLISAVFLIGIVAFCDVDSSLNTIVLILLVITYFSYLLNKQYQGAAAIHTKKEKFLALFLSLFLIFAGLGYRYYRGVVSVRYEYEPLIGVKDEIVMLPYSKQHGEGVLFEDFLLEVDSPLFADNYLLYHPEFNFVENRDIKDFKLEGSYMVLPTSEDGFFKEVLRNGDFREMVSSQMMTPTFYIEGSGLDHYFDYSIEVTFDCKEGLEPRSLNLSWFSLSSKEFVDEDEDEDGGVELLEEAVKFLAFPGCDTAMAGDTAPTDHVSYRVPLNNNYWGDEMVLFELTSSNLKDIVRYGIFREGVGVRLNFIEPYVTGKVFEGGRGSKMVAYSPEVVEGGINFENSSEGKFNLSFPINILMKQGLLNQPFIMWTSDNKIIILRD